MKKILSVAALLVLLLTIFSSCSKKDNTINDPSATSNILVQGTWRVTYFNDSGTDDTADYDSLIFTFTAGGAVAASNDILAINGTWNTYNNDGRNNLLLNFGTSFPLTTALNHDWHIIEKTSIKLRMEDVSGGGSGTDYLTIEKN